MLRSTSEHLTPADHHHPDKTTSPQYWNTLLCRRVSVTGPGSVWYCCALLSMMQTHLREAQVKLNGCFQLDPLSFNSSSLRTFSKKSRAQSRLCGDAFSFLLANKLYKPQMSGTSLCFIKLGLLRPPCPCWCARGGGSYKFTVPTVWVVASMKGSIKERNVRWQPRDTNTYYWTLETSAASERDATWLFAGKSFNPSISIILTQSCVPPSWSE